MHDTAYRIGKLAMQIYCDLRTANILEIGARMVNGGLRDCAFATTNYFGVDVESGPGVDAVIKPGGPLPVTNDSIDLTIATSVFEHDPAFWVTFVELCRVTKPGGFIYINAPSNGAFHQYPKDYWRFYPDAGLALQSWTKSQGIEIALVESFLAERESDIWNDFVAVFCKGGILASKIPQRLLSDEVPSTNVRTYRDDEVRKHRDVTEDILLLQSCDRKLRRLEAENKDLQQSIRLLTDEVTAVRNSRSWRITAPLRKLASIIHRDGYFRPKVSTEPADITTFKEANTPISVVEKVTKENFFPTGYMLANPDLKMANVDPEKHFYEHGQFEDRKQICREFLENTYYRKEKFNRFRSLIMFDSRPSDMTFPVFIGTKHFDLDEYQAESANASFGPFIEEIERNPDKLYLDLGCGLRDIVYRNCLYLEVYPSVSADVIVSGDCKYPIKSESLDGIGCFAVLEHTRKPWLVVEEIYRMLKPGGIVFIDWPFLQPVHGFPSHYFNATREGLTSIFTDLGFSLDKVDTLSFQGPDYTVNWVLGKFINDLPDYLQSRILKMSVSDLISQTPQNTFWQEILSHIEDETKSEFACGNTLIARKKCAA